MMAAMQDAPSALLKPPELVIGVIFTGVRPSRSKWRLFYCPPLTLAEALTRLLEDVSTPAWNAGLARAIPEREPPIFRDAVILHSAGKGEGRWPLAYLTADAGELDVPALRKAFAGIGGQV